MSNSVKAKLMTIGYISVVAGLLTAAAVTENKVAAILGLLVLFMPVFLALYTALLWEVEWFLDRRACTKELREYWAKRKEETEAKLAAVKERMKSDGN